ncbi:MAG TPA: acyltransferase [Verrucomicrobiae bacterium]|nr:acyltransferase [Verrucomicrobiae bacterium]
MNGLRAISILLVISCHANICYQFVGSKSPLSLCADGRFGVGVFFVISGFLITTLLLREEEENGRISIKKFYLRRAFRILPAYYAVLLAYAVLQWASVLRISLASWMTALTYTSVFYPGGWETAHFWSLSTEEIFYLAWPFIFVMSPKFRKSFSILVVAYYLVLRLAQAIFPAIEMGSLAGDAIMWGCIFALWHEEILGALTRAINRCRALACLPFLMIFLLKLAGNIQSNSLAFRIVNGAMGTTVGTVADVCIGLIILFSIHFTHNFWFAFLNFKWVSRVGILSYSLYLWQELFFVPSLGILSVFPINFLCMFIVAALSYWLIEKPFLRFRPGAEPRRQLTPVVGNNSIRLGSARLPVDLLG